jgi:acetyltransferase
MSETRFLAWSGTAEGEVEPGKKVALRDGSELLLRPIQSDDKKLLQDLIDVSDPEDLRLRFFAPMKRLTADLAVRLTELDSRRDMALVAEAAGEIIGVVRLATDPNGEEAEFAIFVRSDSKGHGLGWALMEKIIAFARHRGLRALHGVVLRENATMLRMAEDLGFERRDDPDDPDTAQVRIDLRGPSAAI